jgi:hypothetical protein
MPGECDARGEARHVPQQPHRRDADETQTRHRPDTDQSPRCRTTTKRHLCSREHKQAIFVLPGAQIALDCAPHKEHTCRLFVLPGAQVSLCCAVLRSTSTHTHTSTRGGRGRRRTSSISMHADILLGTPTTASTWNASINAPRWSDATSCHSSKVAMHESGSQERASVKSEMREGVKSEMRERVAIHQSVASPSPSHTNVRNKSKRPMRKRV